MVNGRNGNCFSGINGNKIGIPVTGNGNEIMGIMGMPKVITIHFYSKVHQENLWRLLEWNIFT